MCSINKLKIGLVGCGAIGRAIAKYCADELPDKIQIVSLCDLDRARAEAVKMKFSKEALVVNSVDEVAALSSLIIEAASVKVSAEVLETAVRLRRDSIIMSAGGIFERKDLLELARRQRCRVYIPSGAIFGLDGVKAAGLRKIEQIVLTTRKPKEGLRGAPYIEKEKIDLDTISSDKLIFEGSVKEAVEAFPRNINVSAVLNLAGAGNLRVRIICSPALKRNIHEVEVKGECGNLFVRAENIPLPDNPKSSCLAALSAITVLKDIISDIKIGA